MHRGYRMVKDAVRHCPLLLLDPELPKSLKDFADSLFPRSIGIEVECRINYDSPKFSEDFMELEKHVMALDFSERENRSRFHTGIQGFVGVFKFCQFLQRHAYFNELGSIHYHVDLTDVSRLVTGKDIRNSESYILKQLEPWNYLGKYNAWSVGSGKSNAVNFSYLKTIEYRVDTVSFDYPQIISRMLDCQRITKNIAKPLKYRKYFLKNREEKEKITNTKALEAYNRIKKCVTENPSVFQRENRNVRVYVSDITYYTFGFITDHLTDYTTFKDAIPKGRNVKNEIPAIEQAMKDVAQLPSEVENHMPFTTIILDLASTNHLTNHETSENGMTAAEDFNFSAAFREMKTILSSPIFDSHHLIVTDSGSFSIEYLRNMQTPSMMMRHLCTNGVPYLKQIEDLLQEIKDTSWHTQRVNRL